MHGYKWPINWTRTRTVTFKLLREKETNMLGGVSLEQKKAVRKTMISCFMATDMVQHQNIVSKFALRCEGGKFNVRDDPKVSGEDRLLLLNGILHAADLSNPSRPFDIARQWATAINNEWCVHNH